MVMHLLRYKKMVVKQYALIVGLKHNLAMECHLIQGLNLIEKPCGFTVKCTVLKWVTQPTINNVWMPGLGVQSTTAAGLAGGSVATGSITVPGVIDDLSSFTLGSTKEAKNVKTCQVLAMIYDCGSNQLDDNHDGDDDDDELLQQFEVEHNIYEFIWSFASV
ncbi:hypothetical protein Tco_0834949 [Tanacetum coccineum]